MWEVSFLIGPDNTFIRKGNVLANRAGHYIYQKGNCPCLQGLALQLLGKEVSFLLEPDTRFIRKGSVSPFCQKNSAEPVKSCLLTLSPRAAPLGLGPQCRILLTQPCSAARIVPNLCKIISGPVAFLFCGGDDDLSLKQTLVLQYIQKNYHLAKTTQIQP